ncbi:hypothetical protein [uncultured Mailhella sp.]|uniref:hypothetical protein n=1 Tax=uncultured Mailhella sp. TaxID=1981031 RepID=UPI0032086D5F
MKRKTFLLGLLFLLASALTACVHPYEGKHFSRSYPHSVYNGLPLMETITMGSTNGASVTFNYKLDPVGNNKYVINGTMDMSTRVDSYADINIYLLLLKRGDVVEAVRMNSRSVALGEKIDFSKEFETDKDFNALTFNFNVRYYH